MSNVAVLEKTERTEPISPNLEIEIKFAGDSSDFTINPCLDDVHLGAGPNRSITFKTNETCVLVVEELFGPRTYVLEPGEPMRLPISNKIGRVGPSVGISWSVGRLRRIRGEIKPFIP